jgi:Bacterial Ig-like domain (group 3)
LLAPAASASAANRFAEVGGNGPEPCLVSDPCSIEVAINDAVASDDVTLLGGQLPNPYVVTTTTLSLDSNVTVHGTDGARPVIQTNIGGIGVELSAGSVLRDVIVEFSGINNPAIRLTGGGTLERVSGAATEASGSASGGCQTFGAGSYLIKNSVCWHGDTTGLNGGGIEARNQGAGAQTLVLRNVTAVTANTRPGVRAIETSSGTVTVNATNVITQSAAGEDVEVPSGFGGTVNLDHSNYDTEDEPGAMTDVITNPGTGTADMNQTTPPVFADAASGDFRQLSGSTGTIDLGTANGVLPDELDFEGHDRAIGAAPDIGADEIRNPTSHTVACVPTSLTVGAGTTTCTATVADTGSTPMNPSGSVNFTTNGIGTFSGGGSCTLLGNAGQPSCQVTYTPTVAGSGSHQITAAYPGDSAHEPSQGSTAVGVLRHPTGTAIACVPTSLTLGAGSTTCTAAVTDIGSSPTNPTGSVNFTSTGTGTFSGGGACSLVGNAGQRSCQVTYAPTAAGSGSHQITAAYLGDAEHAESQGSTQVSVLAPAGTVPVSPADGLAKAIKKCKKKFPEGPKRKKCIKRAKKRAQA